MLPSTLRPSARRSWHRHGTHVLRHPVTFLHRRTRGNGFVPAFHVWILLQINGLPFEPRDPRPDGNVGDGIIVGDKLTAAEPRVEHLVEPMRFLKKAFLGVRGFAFVVFDEVVHLTEERADRKSTRLNS